VGVLLVLVFDALAFTLVLSYSLLHFMASASGVVLACS
jgi:hypothetical protein